MLAAGEFESIIGHLGGEGVLARIGARDIASDDAHLSFKLGHCSPKGVRSVIIACEPHGFYNMHCYGGISPGTFHAPLIGAAQGIVPENLATVLGQLSGLETIHHRHF